MYFSIKLVFLCVSFHVTVGGRKRSHAGQRRIERRASWRRSSRGTRWPKRQGGWIQRRSSRTADENIRYRQQGRCQLGSRLDSRKYYHYFCLLPKMGFDFILESVVSTFTFSSLICLHFLIHLGVRDTYFVLKVIIFFFIFLLPNFILPTQNFFHNLILTISKKMRSKRKYKIPYHWYTIFEEMKLGFLPFLLS